MAESLGEFDDPAAPPETGVQLRAAGYLNATHGQDALSEAIRHGMIAKQRGDEPATAFWCGVCSLLVHMRQAGSSDPREAAPPF